MKKLFTLISQNSFFPAFKIKPQNLVHLFIFLSYSSAFAQNGQMVKASFEIDGNTRTYQLYVPAHYDGSEAWPLIVDFHPISIPVEFYLTWGNWQAYADTADLLLLYPEAPLLPNNGLAPGAGDSTIIWNDGVVPETGVDDVNYVQAAMDSVKAQYNVDNGRVYAVGFGGGAGMAGRLACELDNPFAAIGDVQGIMLCPAPVNVPSILFFSTADPLVPFNGGPFPPIQTLMDTWAGNNGCTVADTMDLPDINTADSSTVTLFTYDNCNVNGSTQFYRINNGGRFWPGADPSIYDTLGLITSLGNNVNQDIDATALIWEFFRNLEISSNPLPEGVVEKKIIVDSIERSYLVYVPSDYDGTEDWPLIIDPHPNNSSAEEALVINNWPSIADTAKFLVAYPRALLLPNLGVPIPQDSVTYWNDGVLPESGIDDVAYINALIEDIIADYSIDQDRIYGTGLGGGAGIIGRTACEIEGRFAAIADVQGIMLCSNSILNVPTVIFFNTADPFVPFAGNEQFPPIQPIIDAWAGLNACSGADSTNLPDINLADSSTVTFFEYRNCTNNAPTHFYRINNGGRSVPGSDPNVYPPEILALIGNINQDINAIEISWEFFRQFPSDPTVDVSKTLAQEIKLRVFPNPAKESVHFQFDIPQSTRGQLVVLNALGQLVYQSPPFQLNAGAQNLDWLISSQLAPGIYTYVLKLEQQWISDQLIINR